MKTIGSTIIMLALASSLFADNGKELKLASPDGTHEIVFYQKQVSPAVNELCYRVDYKSQPVVNESRAGLELDFKGRIYASPPLPPAQRANAFRTQQHSGHARLPVKQQR